MPPRPSFVALGLAFATTLASPALATPAPAPLPPAPIAQELRSLRTVGSVLHIAAHPDDENTELITYLARGRGYRTAYLSLTRGDGGQNELGRDFDEKLGLLRTHELLAARQLDNGRQFFTRAIDFGFSKTPEETLAFWNKREVLSDVVRVIRQFRPDVIVTRFPIPPGSGGHGHHTASGMLSVEAFQLAGDPNAYPEQLAEGLTPWQPRRLLWNVFRFTPGSTLPLPGTPFAQDIAGVDPITGEEFGTIAAHSRAQHKTQGLGGFVTRARTGPNNQTFLLLAGEPATSDLMEGIDTSWARYPGGAEIGTALAQIATDFKPDAPAASVPALLEVRKKLAALAAQQVRLAPPAQAGSNFALSAPDPVLEDKLARLDRVLASCVGLQITTTADRAEITPGETLHLSLAVTAAQPTAGLAYLGSVAAPWSTAEELAPAVSTSGHDGDGPPLALAAGATHRAELAVKIPTSYALSQPYWLRQPSAAGISIVEDSSLIGQPINPPSLFVRHRVRLGDQILEIADEPLAADADAKATPRHLEIIPPVSIAFDSEITYAAPGASKQIHLTLTSARAARGTLRLAVPAGWTVAPTEQPFAFEQAGAKSTFTFTLTSPASGGSGRLTAAVEVNGRTYSHQRLELRYAHLPPLLLQPAASIRLASFDLALRAKQIGYLPGAGDYVAECLEQMGATVRRLTDADLTPEKLAGLDAVVIGVRAFNERSDLKDNLPGLFAWVEQGGTVIAQYNRPNGLLTPTLAPFELSIEGPAPRLRVTEEDAPVSLLLPQHGSLTTPNRLASADWDGWVQERGAYFPSKWDESRFAAPLAMSDTGETPLKSSLLIARHGRGHYVYTGLAFFRQLPAGNPGAWRLFANLVSLKGE